MELDLQSVEKVPFSTFGWALAPNKLEIGLPRLRMSRSFLQDLSRAVSRFSRGPVAGNHRRHFFDPTGSNTIWIVHRIEKKQPRLVLRRGRPISNIFGAKAHANVLKGTFSTDCKSNCIRMIRSGTVIAFDPVGWKKCWRWFAATGHLEKRETALDKSWRKLRLMLSRGRLFSNVIGAKPHANVLKGTCSTDWKSNCIIIGLKP